MSAIDLVILGNLIENPKSAYEMKKELEFQNIREWVKIGIPTIYQNLIKLYHKGLLDAKTVREGEMPEKTIYTINEKGREHFQSLMGKYSGTIHSNYFDFCSFVVNLDKVDKESGLEMITNLQNQFKKIKVHMEEEIKKRSYLPYHALAIMKLYEGLYDFLVNWVEELSNEYKKANDNVNLNGS